MPGHLRPCNHFLVSSASVRTLVMCRNGMASSLLKAQSLSRPSTRRCKVSPVISGLTIGSLSSRVNRRRGNGGASCFLRRPACRRAAEDLACASLRRRGVMRIRSSRASRLDRRWAGRGVRNSGTGRAAGWGQRGGGGGVDAEGWAIFFEDWMKAIGAIVRSDCGGEFQRRVQEGFLHRFAIGREVGGMAVEVMEKNCAIRMAGVVVLGSENAAIGGDFAIREFFFFDDDAEGVVGAGVGVEIEIPAENFSEAHGEFGAFAGFDYGFEERAVNRASDAGGFGFGGVFADFGVE